MYTAQQHNSTAAGMWKLLAVQDTLVRILQD
jgi:hypothetical protein